MFKINFSNIFERDNTVEIKYAIITIKCHNIGFIFLTLKIIRSMYICLGNDDG